MAWALRREVVFLNTMATRLSVLDPFYEAEALVTLNRKSCSQPSGVLESPK